jgi:ArsR family transcriptional regulator, lead/cadmium/zinc/bismuth-responsive transcriptional repressor
MPERDPEAPAPGAIACTIRCLRPDDVARARAALGAAPSARVPYVCALSGQRESVLLLAPERARALVGSHPALDGPRNVTICSALADAELCVCDVATLAGGSEVDVVRALADLEARGVIARRRRAGMDYYRLTDPAVAARLAGPVTEPDVP